MHTESQFQRQAMPSELTLSRLEVVPQHMSDAGGASTSEPLCEYTALQARTMNRL
jgi:hypothetical protein